MTMILLLTLTACGDDEAGIDLSKYEMSCKQANDCVMVAAGDVCAPCASSSLGVLARSAQGRYEADVEAANCAAGDDSSRDTCAAPPSLRPACVDGSCGTEPASCGDGVCDNFPWDERETAESCAGDCRCGDGVCDSSERKGTGACAKDCPTTSAGG